MVQFLVDFSSQPENDTGYTTDLEEILFNIETIDRTCGTNLQEKLKINGNLSEMLSAFHYIVFVKVFRDGKNELSGYMYFISAATNDSFAYSFYENIKEDTKEDIQYRNEFMKIYLEVKENIHLLFGKSELVFGND